MMELSTVREFLRRYDGPPCTLMEICGSHTAAIARLGLPSLLSPSIRLLSGPGCPVCVTPSAYIDRLCKLACTPGVCVVTFGDMLRVPGSEGNLQQSRAKGGQVRMVSAPFDLLSMAREEPDTQFIFAAVGFETTTRRMRCSCRHCWTKKSTMSNCSRRSKPCRRSLTGC